MKISKKISIGLKALVAAYIINMSFNFYLGVRELRIMNKLPEYIGVMKEIDPITDKIIHYSNIIYNIDQLRNNQKIEYIKQIPSLDSLLMSERNKAEKEKLKFWKKRDPLLEAVYQNPKIKYYDERTDIYFWRQLNPFYKRF